MSDVNEFNLPKHFTVLVNKYFQDFSDNAQASIASKIFEEEGHPNSVYDLDNLGWWPTDEEMKEMCPKENQDPAKIAVIKKFLKEFSGNDSPISKDLKELLDNTEEFTIAVRPKKQQPTPNGGAVFQKGCNGKKIKRCLWLVKFCLKRKTETYCPDCWLMKWDIL